MDSEQLLITKLLLSARHEYWFAARFRTVTTLPLQTFRIICSVYHTNLQERVISTEQVCGN
jgi:hypothetical protein